MNQKPNSLLHHQQFTRKNNSTAAFIDKSKVYAEGGLKLVFRGRYTTGPRKGQECVSKVFKNESVYEYFYLDSEIRVTDKAIEIINLWNNGKFIKQEIWINRPTIWFEEKSGRKALIEPMLDNFAKFNSNTGWVAEGMSPWIKIMQALSHFSYHVSKRKILLCDIQGGVYRDGFVITDPAIMSADKLYGPTDLGTEGMIAFFAKHRCNNFCRPNWLLPQPGRQFSENLGFRKTIQPVPHLIYSGSPDRYHFHGNKNRHSTSRDGILNHRH